MRYCKKCGTPLGTDTQVCDICGEFVGTTESTQSTFTPPPVQHVDLAYTPQRGNVNTMVNGNDTPDLFVNFCALFFPFLGILAYILWIKDFPIKAKWVRVWSIVGLIAPIIWILCFIRYMFLLWI